jgi:hypothetical protein
MAKSMKRNKARERYRQAAHKAPTRIRTIVAAKAVHAEHRTTHRNLGKFGAASEVRLIASFCRACGALEGESCRRTGTNELCQRGAV